VTSPEPETSGQDAVSAEAVEAAKDVLRDAHADFQWEEWVDSVARDMLTAAAPHIRADERAQVLAEVRDTLRANVGLWGDLGTALRVLDVLGGTRQEAPVDGPSAAVGGRTGSGAVSWDG
jgi:hypothetical protein